LSSGQSRYLITARLSTAGHSNRSDPLTETQMPSPFARLLDIHWSITFFLMGVFATAAAWGSFEIFHLLQANLTYIASYGLMALMEGAAIQLLQLIGWGYASLLSYVLFKACEHRLVDALLHR
jgi:hypothetical protein